MKIVRFEKRVIAYLIDLILSLALAILVYILLNNSIGLPFFQQFVYIQWFEIIIYGLFTSIILKLTNGRTLGNILVGSKVVSLDEGKITNKIAALRGFTLGVLIMVVINAVYMLCNHTERSIFDMISNTIVISSKE